MNWYDVDRVPYDTRVDMLNHIQCFPMVDRVSKPAQLFYQKTLEDMKNKGLHLAIPHNCVRYGAELGIDNLKTDNFNTVSIWNHYGRILNIFNTITSAHDEVVRHATSCLIAILNSQSTTLYDIERIIVNINQVARSLDADGEDHKDAYRELMDCVFKDLLPYKLHGYGLMLELEALDNPIRNASDTPISRGYDQRYLELLINLFMRSLQGLRGKSLDETKGRLKTIAVLIYLFITGVRKGKWNEDELYMFTSYIDKMLNYGVGHHVANLVFEMMDKSATYFNIVSHLDEKDEFLKYAIDKKTRDINDMMARPDNSANGDLNQSWNQMLIVGNGYFAEGNLSADQIDEMCYEALEITPELVSNYVNVEPKDVIFTIPENNLGYLRKDCNCDLCKIYRRRVAGGTPEGITLMYVPPEDAIFMLFNIPTSKDTYGIALKSDQDKIRKILKVGADNSKYNYNLILGGDLE